MLICMYKQTCNKNLFSVAPRMTKSLVNALRLKGKTTIRSKRRIRITRAITSTITIRSRIKTKDEETARR